MATPTTLGFGENPLTGRLRFKLRPLNNWLICCGVFAVVAYAFALLVSTPLVWLADLGAIVILFYVNFFILDKRGIKIRCPHCRKYLRTGTPWICGECQAKNQQIDEFPFVHRCEHCSAEPKAYRCHHCDEPIFLTEDTRKQNCATSLGRGGDLSEKPEPESARYEREKQDLEHQILMTELAAKLDANKQRLEFAKHKNPSEEIEDSFTKHFARHMGSREFARKQKAVNAEKYKDDPEGLKDADDTVDDWLRGRT